MTQLVPLLNQVLQNSKEDACFLTYEPLSCGLLGTEDQVEHPVAVVQVMAQSAEF